MFSGRLIPFPTFGFGRASKSIEIPSVPIYNIETDSDKKTRRFKHLVKLNHVNHAVLFNNRRFHNHTPHLLGSAYLLDASPDHLNDCYEADSKSLVPWEDSPGEISKHDWRDYLGKREYQRAFLDFYEDQMVEHGYDWKAVVAEYLFKGKEPVLSWLMADLGHPLIHLGYAFEVSSRDICMEALTLSSVCYSPMHKYIDDPSYSSLPPAYRTSSAQEVLARIAADSRFDNLSDTPGGPTFSSLFSDSVLESAVLSHWNAWQIGGHNPTTLTTTFRETQKLATSLLINSRHPLTSYSASPPKSNYDFYLLHLLTSSHALRILLPLFPSTTHLPLLKQHWLTFIGYYIAQLRPVISYPEVLDYDLRGRGWDYVEAMAIDPENKHSTDAHYVKGLRAMKVAAETWGDDGKDGSEDGFYLRAAVRFAEEFDGWGGFAVAGEMD